MLTDVMLETPRAVTRFNAEPWLDHVCALLDVPANDSHYANERYSVLCTINIILVPTLQLTIPRAH